MDSEMILNNDVLMHILEMLCLEDQLSFALAAPYVREALFYLFKKTKELTLHKDYDFNTEELSLLMEGISGKLQILRMENVTNEKWNDIQKFHYPNLKRLILFNAHALNDSMIPRMTKIFPNLEVFSPHGTKINGEGIEEWKSLMELDLSCCRNVKFSTFEKIFEHVQLKSLIFSHFPKTDTPAWTSQVAYENFCNLEEITLGSESLSLIPDFSHFKNLKMFKLLELLHSFGLVKALRYLVEHNVTVPVVVIRLALANKIGIWQLRNLKNFDLTSENIHDFSTRNDHLLVPMNFLKVSYREILREPQKAVEKKVTDSVRATFLIEVSLKHFLQCDIEDMEQT